MSPAAAGDGPAPDVVKRYADLLSAWDQSVYLGDPQAAAARHEDLTSFLDGLSPIDRMALDLASSDGGHIVVIGWTRRRLQRLHERWNALQLHGGSWSGWCERLHASRASGDGASPGSASSSSRPSREALREAARDLVYRQAPDGKERPQLWCFCAGALDERDGPLDVPGADGQDCGEVVEEIMLDVERTPHLDESQVAALRSILATHCLREAARAPGHGGAAKYYVQGMHMLAACPLWAGLPEAKALAILEFVLRTLCLGYYVDMAFDTFQRDVSVADALISERFPRLSAALEAAGVSVMMLAFDPLLCLFTQNMPMHCALRLWDVLLLEGDAAMFAALLALLEYLVDTSNPVLMPPRGSIWDGCPFQERMQQNSANIDAEELLLRAKKHLEWPEATGLAPVIRELRDSAASRALQAKQAGGVLAPKTPSSPKSPTSPQSVQGIPGPGWLDDALSTVKTWWSGSGDSPGHSPVLATGSSSPSSRTRVEPVELVRHGTVNAEWAQGLNLSVDKEALAMLPVEFTMVLSDAYKPGEMVSIRGPHGTRMEVRPPEDARPGHAVRYRLGPPPDFRLRVPPGSGPGKEIFFMRKDGVQVSVTVPDGLQPGEVFGVQPPAAMVLVPDGASPGDTVVFRAVGGLPGWLRAQIPMGVQPGKYFAARLPPPPQRRPDRSSSGGWLDWLTAA